jgi:hypothetical protein
MEKPTSQLPESSIREDWTEPEIVDVGGVEELTSWDPQYNLRDNLGDKDPKYKVGT